jgi:uncharacterized protein YecA (UPF0149 family)
VWQPNAIAAAPGATINISNVTVSPCPRCGQTGHIPDGVHQITENGLQIFSRLTPQQREKVSGELRRAHEAKAERDEVVTAIEKLAEGQEENRQAFSEVADEIRKLRRTDWKFWLVVLLAAIQAAGGVTPGEAAKVAREVIQRVISSSPKPKPPPVRVDKVGRNSPCPCGSGDKFKFCHGP